MAFKHGKSTSVEIDSTDISAFVNNTDFPRTADSHDVTTYGKDSHVYSGGLLNGTITISGIYDDGASSPAAIIEPLLGTEVPFIYRPEGAGSGLPERSVQVVVTSYQETAPVADMISWTAELQMSDDVTVADQV